MVNAAALSLVDQLAERHSLSLGDYQRLIEAFSPDLAAHAAARADAQRRRYFGNAVFVRGLIEISNYCRNDCYYCGIRRSDSGIRRYRLTPTQILSCCDRGYELGFRTFVLQGGEDALFDDARLVSLVLQIKRSHPDCAVTLSLGERSYESYRRLFDAGADRYLLRHETATPAHYARLHPRGLSLEHRLNCLRDLKDIGFVVGAGFMVGSPYQGRAELAADLKLIETLHPQMCGIGPFVPHHATPFRDFPRGSAELSCYLLSLLRLIKPDLLLPATTALASIDPRGCERGILAGANVIMPNLSPKEVRGDYALYDHKASTGVEAAEGLHELSRRMEAIGFRVVVDRGDPPPPLCPSRVGARHAHDAPAQAKPVT